MSEPVISSAEDMQKILKTLDAYIAKNWCIWQIELGGNTVKIVPFLREHINTQYKKIKDLEDENKSLRLTKVAENNLSPI